MTQQTLVRLNFLILEASRSHSDTPHSVGILLTIDQPVSETFTWQNTKLATDKASMSLTGFEPVIPRGERPQTHALDRAATGIGSDLSCKTELETFSTKL